jgi:NADH dehydrogenase
MSKSHARDVSTPAPVGSEQVRAHVVIVGAGFGGLAAARLLARSPVEITLIDQRNHHLFQPLLYQVATAGLSPADIAWPIRRLVRGQPNVRVLLGEVTGVDREARLVRAESRTIPYDSLVIATGSSHTYFGHDEWAAHAPGLKRIEDATEIRRRILLAFELAEMEPDADARRRLLTFVVVGAGPTGVEMAGSLAELARKALAADFRVIDPRQARVVLVEAGTRVLPGFSPTLSDYAGRALDRLAVEVVTGKPITGCDAGGVTLGSDRLAAATVIWAAGVAASPAARWLGIVPDRLGRVPVGPDLALREDPNVFVIGDAALVQDEDGRPLPGIAPVAKQQGAYVAQVIAARIDRRPAPPRFRYRDRGLLATVGRRSAVIEYKRLRLTGRFAWWLWGIAHIYFLVSLRNRLMVATHWLWSYITFDRGARLITGPASLAGMTAATKHNRDSG